jgi:hypothetical protein
MASSEDALATLRSIDASLKAILALVQAQTPKAVASDRDLGGKYGDPVLKFSPRDWTGPNYKDCTFSQCPADLLEMVAETFDYVARQAEEKNELTANGKPTAPYKRANAARARGWAKRKREGWIAPAVAAPGDVIDADVPLDGFGSDDTPF